MAIKQVRLEHARRILKLRGNVLLLRAQIAEGRSKLQEVQQQLRGMRPAKRKQEV